MRQRILPITLLALAIVFPGPGRSADPQREQGRAERELSDLERSRLQALVDVDAGILSRVLADDLTYIHSSGRVQTKSELIDALAAHDIEYLAAELGNHQVRIYGSTAVVTGEARMKVRAGSQEEKQLHVRFTDVYIRKEGRWQMVAWQSTPIPEPEKQ